MDRLIVRKGATINVKRDTVISVIFRRVYTLLINKYFYKMLRFFLSGILLLFLYRCNNPHTGKMGETVIKIDMDQPLVNIHNTGFIKDCRLVRLMNAPAVLVGEIDQLVISGNYLYVADYYKSKSIFVFDTLGNYLYKIDNFGRGSTEYLQLRGMWVDTLRQTFNFISRMDRKHFIYDLTGKQLKEVRKLPKTFAEVIWNGSCLTGYSGNFAEDREAPFNVWELDSNDQIKRSFFKISPGWESAGLRDGCVFSEYEGNRYYMTPMNFNVCLLDADGGVSYPYYLDFGKYQWPDPDVSPEKRKSILKSGRNYIDRIYRFQETEQFLFFTFVFEGRKQGALYDKQKDEATVLEFAPYTGKYFIPFGNVVSLSKDRMITVVSAAQIKRICEGDEYNDFEKEYPDQVRKMKALFPDIDESDNPFLVIYSLR